MARDLTLTRRRHACIVALLALLPCLCAPSLALGPAAPFTPPAEAGTPAASTAAISSAPAEITGLAGVRLGTPPQALIDGRWHRPGDTVRGARLHAITRHGATLQHPDGRSERLLLWPLARGAAPAPEENARLR